MRENLGHGHLVGDRISTISFDTLHDEGGLLFGEESIFVGEVDNEEEAHNSEEDGEDSEEDKDPLPTGETSLSTE